MHNLIFELILPCERRYTFDLFECLSSKLFNLLLPCETTFDFEYVCDNNKTFEINLPCEVFNTFTYNNLNTKTFEWSCEIGIDYIYFITADGKYFKVIQNQLLTVQKPI